MPWKEETVENQRRTFVARADEEGCNFSALCREYGISRKTGYKWVERAESGQNLCDQSRAPVFRPRRTPVEMEELILSARMKHSSWGPRKLRRHLHDKGHQELPAASTIAAILRRYGLITPEESAKHTAFKRFQREYPNDLWQMDFKGHFPMCDGNRCHPLTITDDHSRFLLCLDAYDNERWDVVRSSLLRVFGEYGIPNTFLCDNGNPWGDSHGGCTQFELWMMQMDVLPIHGKPLHPQTQGKEERFHRTLNQDVIQRIPLQDLPHAQAVFDAYRQEFNTERPHGALDLDVPSQHYKPGKRQMQEVLREPEYDAGLTLRKVNCKGFVSIHKHRYYLSETLAGKYLELVPTEENSVQLCYGNFIVAEVDLDEQNCVHRRIYRR